MFRPFVPLKKAGPPRKMEGSPVVDVESPVVQEDQITHVRACICACIRGGGGCGEPQIM
jgi:hypothetical protein